MTDTTTRPEVTIDREISKVYAAWENAVDARERAENILHLKARDTKVRRMGWMRSAEQCIEIIEVVANGESRAAHVRREARAAIDEYRAKQQAVKDAAAAYEEANKQYTGWNRYFLVISSNNGHIHGATHCSSFRWNTRLQWLINLSGQPVADAVAEHGEHLCTKCFPDAPVAWQAK